MAKEEAARRNKSKFRTIFEILFLDCIIKCFAVSFAHRNFGIPLLVAAKTAAKTPELNLALFALRPSRNDAANCTYFEFMPQLSGIITS
jgi:ABC-type molybdate transport system permease subunit